jgi:hypothetical protein
MPDGWEYLGLVHEKRDERHAAGTAIAARLGRVTTMIGALVADGRDA